MLMIILLCDQRVQAVSGPHSLTEGSVDGQCTSLEVTD